MNIYFSTFLRPGASFDKLLTNEKHLQLGLLYITIPITGYTFMYIMLTFGHGAPSVFTPWLNIPRESYYAINRFLLAPSMLLCWWASSSFIQITGRLNKGSGTYEQTLSVIALSISISMWGGLIHDIPMSILSATGVIDARQHEIDMNSPTIYRTLLWICYSLYFIAFLILFPLSVRVVHKLNWIKSILIGIPGFLLFQTIFFVFNR